MSNTETGLERTLMSDVRRLSADLRMAEHRADAAEAKLAKIREEHRLYTEPGDITITWCITCDERWPCLTVAILDGEPLP